MAMLSRFSIFGIVVCSLIGLAIGVYIVYQNIERRRTKRTEQFAEKRIAAKKKERDQRRLQKGGMFGEPSPHGGSVVSLARSDSPATYALSPTASIVNWSQKQESLLNGLQASPSVVTMPTIPAAAKHRPPTLRLQPSEAELSGRKNHGSYIPPASPLSPLRAGSEKQATQTGWVSPTLDVQFTRESPSDSLATPPLTLVDAQNRHSISTAIALSTFDHGNTTKPSNDRFLSPSQATTPPTSILDLKNAGTQPLTTALTKGPAQTGQLQQPPPLASKWTVSATVERSRQSPTFSAFPFPQTSIDGEDNRPISRHNTRESPSPKKLPKNIQIPTASTPNSPYPSTSPLSYSSTIDEDGTPPMVRNSMLSKKTVSVYHSPSQLGFPGSPGLPPSSPSPRSTMISTMPKSSHLPRDPEVSVKRLASTSSINSASIFIMEDGKHGDISSNSSMYSLASDEK
ncbi:hypothetical protein BJ878DRAFT_541392 [Calycina marina]|uniref:Uncharacterized protein n=1 Tax=Calycina marina TaxID=1763456 RepID=A0A9P7Z4S4_9HELO|nr:hypothetical protein BJ878DRAFT_541392 [Calycina marina]